MAFGTQPAAVGSGGFDDDIADQVIVLANGKIAAQGTPEEVRHSEDPLVKQFVNALPDGPVRFHHPGPSLEDDFGNGHKETA